MKNWMNSVSENVLKRLQQVILVETKEAPLTLRFIKLALI